MIHKTEEFTNDFVQFSRVSAPFPQLATQKSPANLAASLDSSSYLSPFLISA